MKWKLTAFALLVSAGFIYVMVKGFGKDPHSVPFMMKGQPAPAFSLKRLDSGEVMTLAQLRGKPVVINFWASWCGPCQQEHPVLEWGARTYGSQAQFLGILFEDTEENGKATLARYGGSAFPHLFDPVSGTAVDYGATGVPETYFIDAEGKILDKKIGPLSPKELTQYVNVLNTSSRQEASK